ncbi:TIGR03086 family metal-binding protein [Nocardioides sp. B-3]|uniref:TIGR03086 family metal-binding protein n=1 Tax=Nocardioides sp. B-3 TaxID=2895565 RepID=UPI002152F803|nr:TIGR03086 family metal-binding protein [Nocardioides sp. B-3]UUZ60696.1 TIGR03086 family metal-binding protein [Nocardioides sp. B-3]
MTTFTKTAVLPVSVDEAFALVTQPERLRRWQAVTARVDLRVGGDYRWTVTPGNIALGTVREVEPGKRIVLGFGWEDGAMGLEPDASTLTVTFTPVDNGTEVTLTHEGLTEEQAVAHAEGWTHFLERLERLATTGDAGPDEWAAAPENLDELTAAEATLAVLQPILRGLTEEDRERQTPCADFTGHQLAEHLFGSLVGVGAMAGAEIVNPEEGSLEDRVSTMAGDVIEAYRARGVEGMVAGPGGHDLPATVAATILSIEFLLHARDFARTSGQQVVVSDEVVARVAEHGADIIVGARARGAFGDEVDAPAEASPLDKLAAFAGRRTPVSVVA